MQAGTFKAKAKTWTLAEASTGTLQVAVEFEFASDADGTLERITWYGYLTDAAFNRTIEALRHCGWKGDDLSDLQGLDANEVELVLAEEEYKGHVNIRVQWVNKPGGLAVKAPLAADKAKAFAASMRDRIRGLDASKGKPAAPAAKKPTPPKMPPAMQSAPASNPPDDLPF